MQGHDAINRLGKWIAERSSGELRLVTVDAEVRIQVEAGKAVAVHGLDAAEVARRLGVEPAGRDELLAEAQAVADHNELSHDQAIPTAKEILQEAVASWLADDTRQIHIAEVEADETAGPTISLTHAIVELVLSDESGRLRDAILADGNALLRRSERFLELYSPLRLSEEADLVVAKVTGQRSVAEVSERSPHGASEVRGLLAALLATGILEQAPEPEIELELEPEPAPVPLDPSGRRRRRLPIWMLVAALAVLLLLVIAVAALWPTPGAVTDAAPTDGLQWAIVVDMGCEPQDLQRVLKKSQEHPEKLTAVSADSGDGSPCWRLVWGRFATMDAARQAIPNVPRSLFAEGFTPHAIELPPGHEGPEAMRGDEE